MLNARATLDVPCEFEMGSKKKLEAAGRADKKEAAITNHVFQDQIPADDEGHELADGHVRVDVRGTGLGHSSAELGVA